MTRTTLVIVQCRLGSTRLPQKALKLLDGRPLISWTLCAMKKVPADFYYLATDKKSYEQLKPIAESCGFEIYGGSENDVLQRFVDVINLTKADVLVRATGDNPFLFYDAAIDSVDAFNKNDCDYFTYSGLPHGSGIEVYKTESLLNANEKSTSDYEREHVGPSFYLHKDVYNCVFELAPKKYNYPKLRTTVDTLSDFRRAEHVVSYLKKIGCNPPYSTPEILDSVQSDFVTQSVILAPSVKQGRGTGHFRRCLSLAKETGFPIYIGDKPMKEVLQLIDTDDGAKNISLLKSLPEIFAKEKSERPIIVTDMFKLSQNEIDEFKNFKAIVSIDEGSELSNSCDYLLDIIPSIKKNNKKINKNKNGEKQNANKINPLFIPLPENRKEKTSDTLPENPKVIITVGGEDPASLSAVAQKAFSEIGCETFVVEKPIPNLKEEFYKYDIVVTHYGFTAFEAAAAGCKVVLLETTELHASLAKKYGFYSIAKKNLNAKFIKKIINKKNLYPKISCVENITKQKSENLADFVSSFSDARKFPCPVCGEKKCDDEIVARTPTKTYRRCKNCGIVYIGFSLEEKMDYGKNYFFDDYKAQYGKTYLEDFCSIKEQGIRRGNIIKKILSANASEKKSLLDIGCAYGPFLSAAQDLNFMPYGLDISEDAASYVNDTLSIPAVCTQFPNFNAEKSFEKKRFDAITMWYVIEHFQNLGEVLEAVSQLLPVGGVFAFSTPNANGVSGTFSHQKFFTQSPRDHYSVWETKNAKKILSRYGFKIKKIVSTGHHPERFPCYKKNNLLYKLLMYASKIFKLGDTCEVYCVKLSPK